MFFPARGGVGVIPYQKLWDYDETGETKNHLTTHLIVGLNRCAVG